MWALRALASLLSVFSEYVDSRLIGSDVSGTKSVDSDTLVCPLTDQHKGRNRSELLLTSTASCLTIDEAAALEEL